MKANENKQRDSIDSPPPQRSIPEDLARGPIVAALKVISDLSGTEVPVFSFKNPQDFKTLWSWVVDPVKTPIARIVVAADGLPRETSDRNLNWADFVSVRSWAIVFALACLDQEDAVPEIHILELRDSKTPDVELYDALKAFPSVKLYGLSDKGNSLDQLVNDLITAPSVSTFSSADPRSIREKLWEKLQSSLIRNRGDASTSNHDVSNDIGWMIMWSSLPDNGSVWAEQFPQRCAAQIMLHRLLSPLSISSSSVADDGVLGVQGLNIVLVDDRHADGYENVLSAALSTKVTGRCGVLSEVGDWNDCKNNSDLLDLKTSGEGIFRQASENDFLFLDLRLWQGDDQESMALSRYKPIAEKLVAALQTGGAECDSLTRHLQAAIDATEDGRRSHRRLAMLPLMIAALDPSLPIVLFSSTQHRSVIHSVRDRPNVITDFSKPFIGSDDSDAADPATIKDTLWLAVAAAMELRHVRSVWVDAVTKWEKLDVELKWHPDWPVRNLNSNPDLYPFNWLRKDWLPLAQRQQFSLAASRPWQYLSSVLGETRLAILEKEPREGAARLKHKSLMESIHRMKKIHDESSAQMQEIGDQRNAAVCAAKDLVNVIQAWIPPNASV